MENIPYLNMRICWKAKGCTLNSTVRNGEGSFILRATRTTLMALMVSRNHSWLLQSIALGKCSQPSSSLREGDLLVTMICFTDCTDSLTDNSNTCVHTNMLSRTTTKRCGHPLLNVDRLRKPRATRTFNTSCYISIKESNQMIMICAKLQFKSESIGNHCSR